MEELYLENIDEYVTDQNKIVTYKWLSFTLGVHVNQAKQMLYDYVERKRKENSGAQLHVTYLVTGKHVHGGYAFHKVAIVKEEKLEAVKSKLAVVGSVHVYSIQKAVLKDSGPLFSTDYDIIKANLEICSKFSAIQCSFAVRRAPAEISKPQKSSQESSEHQVASAPIANGHGPPPSSKATAQPSKGIMGMFAAKSNAKPQTTSKDSKPEVKEAPACTASSKATAKSNTVNNFFGKASMKKKASSEMEQIVKEEKPDPQPAMPEPETKVPTSSTVEKAVEKPAEKPVGKSAPRAECASQPKKGRKSKVKHTDLSDSDEENNTKKKRRRINKPQSESSEDEAAPPSPPAPASPATREERSPKPPSPEPPLKAESESQSTEIETTVKKRKRRRVLKSNTFMDEDGCIVTEKTYQSESCTDSEGESAKQKLSVAPKQSALAAVKREPKASKKVVPTVSKGVKQSSIMGFFQKK